MKDLTMIALEMHDYVLEIRREMHKHPETRYETKWTRAFIKRKIKEITSAPKTMKAHKVEIKECEGGIVVNLIFNKENPVILFRADFDALPVQEGTGLPFTSTIAGKSHACGHDVNTAMLLGAMKAIVDNKIDRANNICFVFQDAEENPGTMPKPKSGGELIVQDGRLDDVIRVFALHISNGTDVPLGQFGSRPGALLGNSGRIYFRIKSSGGHVARPNGGVNALRVVNAIMNRLDTFVARHFNPIQPATLEPVIVNSGKGTNVMPAEAEIWYGFRTLLPRDEHIKMTDAVINEVKAVTESLGAEVVETKGLYGHPALINDDEDYENVCEILENQRQPTFEMNPLLGGEDFAHYLYKVPGAMFLLGARKDNTGDHHAPSFNPDESVFWKGVLFWLLLATNKLKSQ